MLCGKSNKYNFRVTDPPGNFLFIKMERGEFIRGTGNVAINTDVSMWIKKEILIKLPYLMLFTLFYLRRTEALLMSQLNSERIFN